MGRIGSREFWVPGRQQGTIFFLIGLLGLGAWAFRVAAAPVVGSDWPKDGLFFLLDQAFDTGVALYALLALTSGFVAPKGFYLWGIAIVPSHPFAALALTAYRESQGFDIVRGGAEGWVGYAFVLVMMTFATAMLITALSAAGAGLRTLSDHLRHGRPGTPHDVRAR